MFSPHRLTTSVTAVIGAAALVFTLATAGNAAASAVDDNFITQMPAQGIAFTWSNTSTAGTR